MKRKSETKIDALSKQRRLNVQEQILLNKNQVCSEAVYWRKNGVPKPLLEIFRNKGIDVETSIFLDYNQDYPGMCTEVGMVLTASGKFFKFEIDLNSERTELIEITSFTNVSKEFEVAERKRGIGKTFGQVAIEVLLSLNQE